MTAKTRGATEPKAKKYQSTVEFTSARVGSLAIAEHCSIKTESCTHFPGFDVTDTHGGV
ncbi:hypothetical protein MGG_16295 [Pyricularia oryzae 70-15]|uniref:Uncharacterized protein n=1 Tax=Pyricularia oryzae (strain 70-15 / ATCC MYA-4617 / FGSC 8958) TaxID=242507 RepID=G4MR78_PYRO7|nr:uncharacterized protein MGG_16295 [Pyricularia oryzae 70-15]EHA57410.1 hypothetical protein MGG_16295 [Pyricularia oryzae 70-15]